MRTDGRAKDDELLEHMRTWATVLNPMPEAEGELVEGVSWVMGNEFAQPKAHPMSLRSCSFLQCFDPFEPARRGRMVSLRAVKIQPLTFTTPCHCTAKGHCP